MEIKFTICTLIFVTYGNGEDVKNNILQNFKLIVDVAEFFKVKFLVIFPLENVDHTLIHFLRTTQFYFSVVRVENLEMMTFPEFRTMVVYIPRQNKCCSNMRYVSKYPNLIWLVINNNRNTGNQDLDLNNTYLPFNCQFLVAEFGLGRNNAAIVEMYQFHPESKVYSQPLGFWKDGSGLNLTNATFFERRSNFYGESILVQPYVFVKGGAAGESRPTFIPDVWNAITKRINATDKETTNQSVYDVLVNFFLPKESQELPVVLRVKSVLYYKVTATDFNESSFVDPFKFDVWLSILCWIILSSVGMLIINKFLHLTKENFSFFLLDAFYVILQQGTQITENTFSFFAIKTLQLTLSLFLFIFYGSVLISFVTVSDYQIPFSDLEGIYQDGRYNILAQPTRGYDAFKYSRPGIVRDLFIKQVTPLEKQPESFQESFYIICEGKEKVLGEIALQFGPTILRHLNNTCRANYVPFTELKMGFQMPPKNPFREIIGVCVTKLLEGEAVGEIFWSRTLNLKIKDTIDEGVSGITIKQVSTLFMILLLGIFACFLGLILEIRWHKKFERDVLIRHHHSSYMYYNRSRRFW